MPSNVTHFPIRGLRHAHVQGSLNSSLPGFFSSFTLWQGGIWPAKNVQSLSLMGSLSEEVKKENPGTSKLTQVHLENDY